MDKYKWKFRLLLIKTPSKDTKQYSQMIDIFNKNKKIFHKVCIKLIVKISKNFSISLIGFDGKVKHIYYSLNVDKIITHIRQMPMGYKKCPINQSLYEDYNPEKTIHGLGYKNKEKALYTIERIKKEPIKYQVNVISTMLGRAKNHIHQTKDMKEAIKIFEKWLKKYHLIKKIFK